MLLYFNLNMSLIMVNIIHIGDIQNIEAINKENLLKSNKEIVSIDGFNSLNMRNLALKNNIGLGAIYNYLKQKKLLIITFASICKEFFNFNFMKNSRHFVLFLKNYIKFIKDNSTNEEVFNEKFTKMNLIDFIFGQIVLMLYKEEFNTQIY